VSPPVPFPTTVESVGSPEDFVIVGVGDLALSTGVADSETTGFEAGGALAISRDDVGGGDFEPVRLAHAVVARPPLFPSISSSLVLASELLPLDD